MNGELFIYWRTPVVTAAQALAAAQQLQTQFCARHAALVARLYRRQDDAAGRVTVMETYARAGGVGAELQAEILRDGDHTLQAWCPDGRHVEVFEPVGAAAPAPR